MNRSPSIRFRIDFADSLHVGPGKIALLESILDRGSLNMAAGCQGLSYRRAWLLLASLNRTFDEPVVQSTIGGKHGGGSEVTAFGRLLIKSYRRMEAEIAGLGEECLKEILPHVNRPPPAAATPRRQRLARKDAPAASKKPRA